MEKQQVVINKVPTSSVLAKRIPALGKSESRRYRLHGSYDPITKKRQLRDVCIPNRDIVIDPETGDVYDIGYVANYGEGGMPVFGEIWFESAGLCEFTLHGNKVRDQKIYQFIEQSNYIMQNEYRDKSAPLLIERVDETTDSDIVRTIRKDKQKALNVIDAMDDKDVTSLLKQLNLPVGPSENSRRETLEEHVDKGGFKAILNASTGGVDEVKELIALIESLKKSEKIAFDKTTGAWTAADTTLLCTVKKGVGVSNVGEFAKFLQSEKGKDSYEKLKSL